MVKCDSCGKNVENYVELENKSKENIDKGKGLVVLCLDCKGRSDKKR